MMFLSSELPSGQEKTKFNSEIETFFFNEP